MALTAGTCADPVHFPLYDGVAMPAVGSTVGMGFDHLTITCGGTLAPDVVFSVVPHFTGDLRARTDDGATPFDAVIAARSSCPDFGGPLACDRDANGGESITVGATSGTPVYVWVDGANGASGDFRLLLDAP